MVDIIEHTQKHTEAGNHSALAPSNGAPPVHPEMARSFNHELASLQLRLPEAYVDDLRKVAGNLHLLAMGNPALRVIGFASALPQEGVSTTLCRLALVMVRKAEENYTAEAPAHLEKPEIVPRHAYGKPQGIFLVDAQQKNPTLHKMLKTEIQNGLIEIADGEFGAEALSTEPADSNLKIMTTPASPLDEDRLAWLLETVKSRVEFVFVDIPPLLHSAEGVAISRLCDGVVLVVRAHHTRWEIVREAKRQLQATDVNVLGCVLNRRKFFTPEWLYRRL